MLDFLVDSVTSDGLIIGRNGDEDIPVGTTFSTMRRLRVHRIANDYQTEDLGIVASIALTLREVFWYRPIQLIPRGHSAGLRVDGHGLTELKEQLKVLPAGYYISLIASQPEIAKSDDGSYSRTRPG